MIPFLWETVWQFFSQNSSQVRQQSLSLESHIQTLYIQKFLTHNSQKVKANQMPINWWMYKSGSGLNCKTESVDLC